MLRDYLGADTFKRGIVQYLQKYSYKNTKNEDLWNSMASVSVLDSCPVLPFSCIMGPIHKEPSAPEMRLMFIFGFRFVPQMACKQWMVFALEASIHHQHQ